MNRACLPIGITLATLSWLVLSGCEVRSYFDPSKTGRFEYTPTTIPILKRIDVIERQEDPWAKATTVVPEDLLPSDLTYRLSPGDFVTVEIFELLVQGQVTTAQRRIGPAGYFRLPLLGDVRAAGLTAQEFQDKLVKLVDEKVIRDPQVNVVVEEGAGFQFTLYGAISGSGLYALRRPDFHLLDALALAGGVPLTTRNIYVIRRVALSDEYIFQPARQRDKPPPSTTPKRPLDIEDLIQQLDEPGASERLPGAQVPPAPPKPPARPPADIDELIDRLMGQPGSSESPQVPPIDIEDLMDDLEDEHPSDDVTPALFAQETGPVIDIDELEPVRVAAPPTRQPAATAPPQTDAVGPLPEDLLTPRTGQRDSYIYVEERDEWVPVHGATPAVVPVAQEPAESQKNQLILERIIEIPFQKLKQGDSSYNLVIRPGDLVYVQEPPSGVVYIDGEIARPGVYTLPTSGLTLSRLVAAAGGPSPLAIPERVDLTRIVGENREATIRLNLAAIRMKTQPDLYLKPDDHILIGTNFWALPLAVFRNGFRVTYGFGFLLDRNFGNDVFGAPPVNRGF